MKKGKESEKKEEKSCTIPCYTKFNGKMNFCIQIVSVHLLLFSLLFPVFVVSTITTQRRKKQNEVHIFHCYATTEIYVRKLASSLYSSFTLAVGVNWIFSSSSSTFTQKKKDENHKRFSYFSRTFHNSISLSVCECFDVGLRYPWQFNSDNTYISTSQASFFEFDLICHCSNVLLPFMPHIGTMSRIQNLNDLDFDFDFNFTSANAK